MVGAQLFFYCYESHAQVRIDKERQLVVAAYELDVATVKALLAEGVNPNARIGVYDETLFENKWSGGYSPVGSENWTPLLAVANSHREPQPLRRTERSVAAWEAAHKKRLAVDPKLVRERDQRRAAITKLLIAANADLNLDDGCGLTALGSAAGGYEEVALQLIEAGAKIDTKTGVHLDGPIHVTPMHNATSSPKILAALLEKNGKVDANDSTGETPLHWAARHRKVESVKMLLAAGADPSARNKKGHTPLDLCPIYREDPHAVAKQAIRQQLMAASKKP